ncbi:MAG TPA: hypothetical protein VJP76_01810, partial [Candidatus Tumulicola sp.]|nr:hypothetical protein [Candidatus Tumulicola sp.]
MERFAETADAIGATAAKLEKTALLAAYLHALEDRDLVAAARFFTGRPFAARDDRTLSIGSGTLIAVAKRLWGFGDDELHAAYARSGDLGTALGSLARPPRELLLLEAAALVPERLSEHFDAIASPSGKNAARRREAALEMLLRACTSPDVAAYVMKIVTGDLRIGLREGLVADAIARAFDVEPAEVRRAIAAAGDVGAAALAAKNGTLADVRVAYGAPLAFMLANPIAYAQSYDALHDAAWTIEDKYDGIRAQAHVRAGNARLFSRTLADVGSSYPDVVAALERLGRDAILDGELVAMRDGRVLPFRDLQARLRRKHVEDSHLRDVPLVYVAFDLLAEGDDLQIDRPYALRRQRLETLLEGGDAALLAPAEPFESGVTDLNARFEAARARGHEGLMLKRDDSPYASGRRGKYWLKLKRELATLDVVVVAVEWGHGKRAGVLSDYTFAVRDVAAGRLAAIGKAYSGLTDAEIAGLTPWFLEHRLPPSSRRSRARASEIPVQPEIVLE